MKSGGAVLIMTVMSVFLAACSLIDVRDEVSYGDTSHPITQSTLNLIQPKQTSIDSLQELLGNPSFIADSKDGAEIYTYRFEEKRRQRTRILFLFSYRMVKTVPRYIYVKVKDGKVDRVWKDSIDSKPAPSATIPPKPLPEVLPEPTMEAPGDAT